MARRYLAATVIVSTFFAAALGALPVPPPRATGPGSLVSVVFAHRHGARTPIIDVDGSCGTIGCGTLTLQGAKMLESLGRSFRERYGSILPNYYDTERFTVTSDGSDRVVQSAAAFATGLFQYNSSYTPLPATKTTGGMLVDPWSTPMTYKLHQAPMYVEAVLNISSQLEAIINRTTLAVIADELKLPGIACDIIPQACMDIEADTLASFRAEGRLSEFPVGAANFNKLNEARTLFYRTIDGQYDLNIAKNDFFAEAGWPAVPLLNSMLGVANDPAYVLGEFSGHDTTLSPLYAAMGNLSFDYPEFATAVVFEVYETAPSGGRKVATPKRSMAEVAQEMAFGRMPEGVEAAGTAAPAPARFIKAYLATCEQTPGEHPYTYAPMTLNCIGVDGTGYTTEAGCPLADLTRFAASRQGRGGSPPCYVWPRDLELIGCRPGQYLEAPDGECKEYRTACPLSACQTDVMGSQQYYLASDLSCQPLPPTTL